MGGTCVPIEHNVAWTRPTSVPSGILIHSAIFGHNRYGPKIGGGGCALFFWGAGTPSNRRSPGTRPTSIPSGILVHPAVWPQQTWAENWRLCPFRGGELGPRLTQCRLGEAYLRTKWHLDRSSRLATIDTGLKLGGCASFFGELGSYLAQCGLGRRLLPYQVASSCI